MNIDDKIKQYMDGVKVPTTIFEYHKFGVSLFVWKLPEFYVDVIETEPYQLDGSVPLLMIKIGFVELMFENKLLYKIIYKRKNGFTPMGLEE